MKIIVNGREKELPMPLNLTSLVGQFSKNSKRIIAEVNGQIVKNPSWNQTQLRNGDVVELISFVGGG